MQTRFVAGEAFEYITPDGQPFRFDAGLRCTLTVEGLGLPASEYITTRGPGQHGETVIGMRYQTRLIQLTMQEDTPSRFDYWDLRARMIAMMRPDRQLRNRFDPGKFRVYLPDGSRREIPVLLAQGLSFAGRDMDSWQEWSVTEVIRFVAHDPFWYDPLGRSTMIGPVVISAPTKLVFPFTFRGVNTNPFGTDLQLGYAGEPSFDLTGQILLAGDRAAFPTILITGPVKGPSIINTSTNEALRLLYNVAAGETVTITLQAGYKRALSSLNGDITGTVSQDLDTFHLENAPGVNNGMNNLRFQGSAPQSGVTACSIWYYPAYTGI